MNSNATITQLQRKSSPQNTTFKISMTMDPKVHAERGAPATLEALVIVPHGSAGDSDGGLEVSYTLQWFQKTQCHAPETIWLRNTPAVTDAQGWAIDKLGSMVNPLDADLRTSNGGGSCNPIGTTCGVHLHAIDSGAYYKGSEGTLSLHSLDSMLVSVGEPLPAPTPLTVPDPLGGIHFSLVDNTWNTNCALHFRLGSHFAFSQLSKMDMGCVDLTRCLCSDPEWYPFIQAETATPFPGGQGDENSRFRFQIRLS